MSDGWTLLVSTRQIVQFLDGVVAGIALGLVLHASKVHADKNAH